jgi:phage-related protein
MEEFLCQSGCWRIFSWRYPYLQGVPQCIKQSDMKRFKINEGYTVDIAVWKNNLASASVIWEHHYNQN